MNKKIITGILVMIVLLIMLLLDNQYHFIYGSPCGIGLVGLKLLAVYSSIVLMTLWVVWTIKQKKSYGICKSCKSDFEEEWIICPYCGVEIEAKAVK